jgi:hypothetical protein
MTTEIKEESIMYHCDICNYTCHYESHWEQHIKTKKHMNNGIRTRCDKILDRKCKFCQYDTKNSHNMLVHVLTKHSDAQRRKNEFKYYCDKCDVGTFTKILFSRHLETAKHNAVNDS